MLIALIAKLISWIPKGTDPHVFTPVLLAIDSVLPEDNYSFITGQADPDEMDEIMSDPDYRILN